MGPPKIKWTPEEEAAVMAGIAKYGEGRWSKILKDPQFGRVLYLRSKVDIKDKWRNIHVMTNGVARQRSSPGVKTVQPTAEHVDSSGALNTSVKSEISDHNPLEVPGRNLSTGGPTKTKSRLDARIFEAMPDVKDPHGSKRTTVAKHIEILHEVITYWIKFTPKVFQENYQYRISKSLPFYDAKDPSMLLLDRKKHYLVAETNGSKYRTSQLLLDDKKGPPRAETNGNKFFTSSLVLSGKRGRPRIEKNGSKVPCEADIDAELEKMKKMTPEEAAAYAEQAVKVAEAAIAAAEEAAQEAEDAEREAAAAQAFADATSITGITYEQVANDSHVKVKSAHHAMHTPDISPTSGPITALGPVQMKSPVQQMKNKLKQCLSRVQHVMITDLG